MYFLLIDDHPLMVEAAEVILSAVFPKARFKKLLGSDEGFKPTQLTRSLVDYLAVSERQANNRKIDDQVGGRPIHYLLSKRQIEVMELACQGKTLNETAAILGISANTASTHLRAVFERLEASNRAHAVSLYIKAKSLASAFDVWPD